MKKETEPAETQVSNAVRAWLRDLSQVLKLVDEVLAQCHANSEVPSDLRETVNNLRPMVRQCRAQTPTEEMVRKWVQVVTKKGHK